MRIESITMERDDIRQRTGLKVIFDGDLPESCEARLIQLTYGKSTVTKLDALLYIVSQMREAVLEEERKQQSAVHVFQQQMMGSYHTQSIVGSSGLAGGVPSAPVEKPRSLLDNLFHKERK